MIKINIIDEIKDYNDKIHVRMSYDITNSIIEIHRRDSYFIKRMILLNYQEECKYKDLKITEEIIFNKLKEMIDNEFNDKKDLLKDLNLDVVSIEKNVNKILKTSYKDILRSEKLKRLL